MYPSDSSNSSASQPPKSAASASPQIISITKSSPSCEADAEMREFQEESRKKAVVKARAKARLTIQVPPLTPRSACSVGKASPAPSHTAEVMSQVDAVVDVFRDNVARLSARGESVAALEARTESLARSAQLFRRSSKRMRRDQQWKEMKMRIIIFISIAVIVGLIVLSIVQTVRRDRNRYDMPTIIAAISVPPSMAAQTVSPPNTVPTLSRVPFPTGASTAIALEKSDEEEEKSVPQIIFEEDYFLARAVGLT